ncbi:aminotransferase [Congregibacter sp.]|uniref:aminotransferase n=1 Tax=Congregibacter sp. TaxID=2744308 RepID=UPI00385A31C2
MNSTADTASLKALDRAHHLHPFTDFHDYAKGNGRIFSRAEGVFIYDSDGNGMLDGMSGLWCCNLGYSQERIKQAVFDQMQQLPYYNNFFNCSNQPAVELAAALTKVAPEGFDHVFFTNSGSEANDTNIRMVHRYYDLLGKPEKKLIISRKNAYHGSTIAAASLGGMKAMHEQAVGLNYIHHINQPHWFELAEPGEDQDSFGLRVARELESKIDELGEDRVAAFIAEPVQGAGGVIVPPDTYWPELQRICNERDILLIADEVICGFGRTGQWWGSQTYGMQPDLITFAKAVTNGYMPLGGVLVSDKVADVLMASGGEFAHGLTYSGHPASCAAGLATLDILHEQNIVGRAAEHLAPYFQSRLESLSDHPIVGQVRGRGCFAAVELVANKETRERLAPESAGAVFCRDTANSLGLMVRQTGDAMIMSPPLICEHEHIDYLMEKLTAALDATAQHYGIGD